METCKQCGDNFPTTSYKKIFCSSSCAATHNNKKRKPRSAESKKRTSDTMKQLAKEGKIKPTPIRNAPNRISEFPFTRLYGSHKCNHCHKDFWQLKPKQKCCSTECRDNIRSQNKCRKTQIPYFSKFDNQYVNLQSTWELKIAKWLDDNGIAWSRPTKRIKWYCQQTNKYRTYLPDFFLVDHCYFIDVKNPVKAEADKEKLLTIQSIIPLYVGDITCCIKYMERLAGLEPA